MTKMLIDVSRMQHELMLMTAEEAGFYIKLFMYALSNDGCIAPSYADRIAGNISNEAYINVLAREFATEGALLRNPFVDEILKNRRDKSEKARHSALVRHGKADNVQPK